MQLNTLLVLKSISQSGTFSSTPNLLYFPSLTLLDKNVLWTFLRGLNKTITGAAE